MLGLNHGTNQPTSYTDIDYAMYFMNGQLQVCENGRIFGTYGKYLAKSMGEVVIGTSGKVHYVLDDEIRYTSEQVPKFPLFVDVSFYDAGAAFSNIIWSAGMATDVAFVHFHKTVGVCHQLSAIQALTY